MARYVMLIDQKLCVSCNACVLACKSENDVPAGNVRCWTAEVEHGTFPNLWLETRSERCNHCGNAPCVSVCPTNASHYEEGGFVLVDKLKCVGCKACMLACPYEARYIHPEGHVEKCTFCVHRVKKGLTTACAQVCPTGAIKFGDLEDQESEVFKLLHARRYKVLKPEAGTKPMVYYLL